LQTDSPQVWRLGWCADEYDASNFFDVGIHPNAYGAWVNPSYNTLVALAALAPDEAARVGYYEDIEEIITESDAIMAPIYYYAYGMATDPRLIQSFGLSGYGGHVEDWRLLDQQLFVPLIMR
jgi:ABC-type oligopeptide transport system substrate-binding subunit